MEVVHCLNRYWDSGTSTDMEMVGLLWKQWCICGLITTEMEM